VAAAERCYADPTCSEVDAMDLYRLADDAGAAGISCFRFYDGVGVAKDRPRARACFQRQVLAEGNCNGSSPSLTRIALAAMRIAGEGGPADPAAAQSLLADCFADVDVEALRVRARGARVSPPTDVCRDLASTTWARGQCLRVQADEGKVQQQLAEKQLRSRLDPTGIQLADEARDAWLAFSHRQAQAEADRYRGGSMQSNACSVRETALAAERTHAVANIAQYAPKKADLSAAVRALAHAVSLSLVGDATRAQLVTGAMTAWTRYRDAEIAFYTHLFGKRFGPSLVADDVETRLTEDQTRRLR
jgi:uncharacterized protein YecT (DUF1311 family)